MDRDLTMTTTTHSTSENEDARGLANSGRRNFRVHLGFAHLSPNPDRSNYVTPRRI
jgi:hypothetical protein